MKTMARGEFGFSLIELMITAGVLTIIGAAMTSMVTSLQKSNSALEQKLEIVQLQQGLDRLLADNTSCSCLFDTPAWSASLTEISVNHLKNGCAVSNLLTVGSPINASSQLLVDTIKVKNITSLGGGNISGDIEIKLKNGQTSFKPIKIMSQSFVTDSVTTPTKITSCLGIAGAPQMCTGMGGTWSNGACAMSPAVACTGMGGSWANGVCTTRSPAAVAPTSTSDCIAQFGPGWTFNGSACVPPPVANRGSHNGDSCERYVDNAGSYAGKVGYMMFGAPQVAPSACAGLGGASVSFAPPGAGAYLACTKRDIAHGTIVSGIYAQDMGCTIGSCQNGSWACVYSVAGPQDGGGGE